MKTANNTITLDEAFDHLDQLHDAGRYFDQISTASKIVRQIQDDPIGVGIIALNMNGLIGELEDSSSSDAKTLIGRAAWVIAHECLTCSEDYRAEMRSIALKYRNPDAIMAEANKKLRRGNRKAVRRYLRKLWVSPDRSGVMVQQLFADGLMGELVEKAFEDWDRDY